MDDVKDYDLDCSIHPERYFNKHIQTIITFLTAIPSLFFVLVCFRPLPRGLLKYDDVVVAINLVLAAMILYAVILGVWFNPSVGITFGIQVNILCNL